MPEEDKEISAMSQVNNALSGLDDDVVARVLRWAADKYGVSISAKKKGSTDDGDAEEEVEGENNDLSFDDFASFYDAVDPSTDPERMLVAGYWFQVFEGETELGSQQLNTALKNLGHGVGHTPKALNSLTDQKPRLVMQIQKKGKSRQARKKFKLTAEGIKKIKSMMF